MQLTDVISTKVIENSRNEFACGEALSYVEQKPRTYNQLARRNKYWLRWLANNSTIPAVLKMLAGHKNVDVRRNVAENPATSKQLLRQLATDKSREVRSSVLGNWAIPVSITRIFLKDKDAKLRTEAAARLGLSR